MKLILTLLISLTLVLGASAQTTPDNTPLTERLIFRVTSFRQHNSSRMNLRRAKIQVAPRLIVFKRHEVRFNNREQWQDEVYPVSHITGRRHHTITTWECGSRSYTLSLKNHTVTMVRRDSAQVVIYYGGIYYGSMFRSTPSLSAE